MSHIDLNRLVGALEPDLRVTLEAAASVAVRMGHRYVDIPHWLLAVVDSGIYAKTFEELKFHFRYCRLKSAAVWRSPSSATERHCRSPRTSSRQPGRHGFSHRWRLAATVLRFAIFCWRWMKPHFALSSARHFLLSRRWIAPRLSVFATRLKMAQAWMFLPRWQAQGRQGQDSLQARMISCAFTPVT